jgi:hypothetical protein
VVSEAQNLVDLIGPGPSLILVAVLLLLTYLIARPVLKKKRKSR